ncbi:MAG: hypothetical protein CL743_06825 [Chloroflexi bacterium]|nr:hypothetical protein [Chloroflexota bacterium]MBN86483.1 hypothetical protein [Dehalococcoidia bacterium]MCH2532702.1 MBL fold metallo-hydrolase [Dehalococcoidia bacterium]HCH35342.1 hypothetical protein [Dehalococcoidia bacterium]
MEITWIGHASLRIRSGNKSLISDPFPPSLGLNYPPAVSQSDVLTLSSSDALHSAHEVINGKPVVLEGPGEYEASGMHIRGIRTTRRTPENEPQLWNTIYVIETEGLVVCHLGNPDILLTNKEIDDLGSTDILILPVGSDSGISAGDCVEIINSASPKVIIPMLYAHSGNKSAARPIDPFIQEYGGKLPESQARYSITKNNLPEEATLVILEPSGTLL